jgi:hypothetical protein
VLNVTERVHWLAIDGSRLIAVERRRDTADVSCRIKEGLRHESSLTATKFGMVKENVNLNLIKIAMPMANRNTAFRKCLYTLREYPVRENDL